MKLLLENRKWFDGQFGVWVGKAKQQNGCAITRVPDSFFYGADIPIAMERSI